MEITDRIPSNSKDNYHGQILQASLRCNTKHLLQLHQKSIKHFKTLLKTLLEIYQNPIETY